MKNLNNIKNNNVGAGPVSARQENKGITLIALIITIIVMLILVAVSLTIAMQTGLFDSAGKATQKWKTEQEKEADLKVNIAGMEYDSVDKYVDSLTVQIPWIYEENEDGNIEITGIDLTEYCGEMNNDQYSVDAKLGTEILKVPSKLDGKKVVKFSLAKSKTTTNDWAKISDVKTLILGEGIEEFVAISEWPAEFSNLERVELPKTVTKIERDRAFEWVPVVSFSEGKNEELIIPVNQWYAEKILIEGVEPIVNFTIIDVNNTEHQFEAKLGDTWKSWVLGMENSSDFFEISEDIKCLSKTWYGEATDSNSTLGGGLISTDGYSVYLCDSDDKRVIWGDYITTQVYYIQDMYSDID